MPYMTLLPNGESSVSSDWVVVGASDVHTALETLNGNTSYVKCNDTDESMVIEFANPLVATEDIAAGSIIVRFLSSGRSSDRRNEAVAYIAFHVPSGFSELCAYDPSPSSYETITGTTRAEKPDATAWTYSDLENLEMICTKQGTRELNLTYLALRIDYENPVTDNATFFGANF